MTAEPSTCCPICHTDGGWTFVPYKDTRAHSDCVKRVDSQLAYRPTLDELQLAERQMAQLGYYFLVPCGQMALEGYHHDNARRYHIAGYTYHFAHWQSFQDWLMSAQAYQDYLDNPPRADAD